MKLFWPSVAVASSVVWVLSVTAASAEASTYGPVGTAVSEPTYIPALAAPYGVKEEPQASTLHWRYY
ncbi:MULTISPECIES: hypothetical protein [unclassified Amycolatopsis]|uniref:hypothetical protein n=1 Tax=unclassified Amycolatopsis TaxID=2618356 RepID=UPI002E167EBB|nr:MULTISPECIES: hypothetical protein [unclassified Amycolatopsis]WSK78047.1 hypothetical protein OG570_42895 [Amycolatopsis sp. NBC_01286]